MIGQASDVKKWYLLYCKRGQVERAGLHLANQNVESWFPYLSVNKKRNGKWQQDQEPLFPSYLFVRLDLESGPSMTTIRSTRGVIDFVRVARVPVVVGETLITELKSRADKILNPEPLKKGDKVTLNKDPFMNVEAVFDSAVGEERAMVLITLLSQKHKIIVNNDVIESQ